MGGGGKPLIRFDSKVLQEDVLSNNWKRFRVEEAAPKTREKKERTIKDKKK